MSENEIIAKSEYVGIAPNGRKLDITVTVSKAVWDPERSHAKCRVELEGLYDELPVIGGGDTFQATWLALRLARDLLVDFQERGGKLYHRGDDECAEPYDIAEIYSV
jgi:hypothetical protein